MWVESVYYEDSPAGLTILITQFGNDDSETSRVFTSYWAYVTSGPDLMTIQPELQVGTGDGVPMKVPIGGIAVGQCCSRGSGAVVARSLLLMLSLSLTFLLPHDLGIHGTARF